MTNFLTIGELTKLANELLPMAPMWGAGSEETYRRGRRALEQLAIEQHMLIGLDEIDISTEFLGVNLPSPVIVAPMGGLYEFHEQGDLEMVRGVTRDGSAWTVPLHSGWPLEEVASEAAGPLFFQLYCDASVSAIDQRELAKRIQACSQYKAVCVTIDTPMRSRIDRVLEARVTKAPNEFSKTRSPGRRFTWDDMARLREDISLPMGLKGIMSARDASLALDHGADFIWVSTHGGHHLDSARASIDALDEVVDAVAGRVPIIVDSGFQRGSDVLKGLAKGATLVAFGQLAAAALGIGGADGVADLLQIVQEEFKIALAMSGCTAIHQLTPDLVRKVDY